MSELCTFNLLHLSHQKDPLLSKLSYTRHAYSNYIYITFKYWYSYYSHCRGFLTQNVKEIPLELLLKDKIFVNRKNPSLVTWNK